MTNNISFPGLGLSFEVNRVAFTVFNKPIFWYAIIILSGFLLALLFVNFTCEKQGVDKDTIFDIGFWGLIFGIIGARIYYCIFDPECLEGNILNVVKIWEGGLAIYGGIIAAVITATVYCKIKKRPILKTFDAVCPGLFIGQAIGRWGNFMNAEVYGRETTSFLRMSINNNNGVHPLFLYESLWNILGLILVILFRNKKTAQGQVFFFYILWYGIGRLILEGMRQPEYILYLVDGKLGISQAVSALAIIIAVVCLILVTKRAKKSD